MPNITSLTQKLADTRLQNTAAMQHGKEDFEKNVVDHLERLRAYEPTYAAVAAPAASDLSVMLPLPSALRSSNGNMTSARWHKMLGSSGAFVLGDAREPMRLMAGTHLEPNLPASLRHMVMLMRGKWSAASFADLTRIEGVEGAAKVGAQLIIEVLSLRAQAASNLQQHHLRLPLLILLRILLARIGPKAHDVVAVTGGYRPFGGQVALFAARALDKEALELLLAASRPPDGPADGLRIHGDVIFYPNPIRLLPTMKAAATSPLWPDKRDDGEQSIHCILHELDLCAPAMLPHFRQSQRALMLLALMPFKPIAMLPLLAKEAHAATSRLQMPENPYLIHAARCGWLEGLKGLLKAGLDPNARQPGFRSRTNNRFAHGETALAAALLATNVSDAVSVKMAHSLIQSGATSTVSYGVLNTDDSNVTLHSIRELVEEAGLVHRWILLEQLAPEVSSAHRWGESPSHQIWLSRLAREVQHLRSLAKAFTAAPDASYVEDVLAGLQSLHQSSLIHLDVWQTACPNHDKYLIESGRRFFEEGYASTSEDCVTDEARLAVLEEHQRQFSSLLFADAKDPLLARLGAWADSTLNLDEPPMSVNMRAPEAVFDAQQTLEALSAAINQPNAISPDLKVLSLLLRGRLDEASAVIKIARYQQPQEMFAAFLVVVSGWGRPKDDAEKGRLQKLGHLLIQQCKTKETLAPLVDASLRVGSSTWLAAVLEQVKICDVNLASTPSTHSGENLLHVAASAPVKLFKSFCNSLGAHQLAHWAALQDETGDTSLHRAVRAGVKQTHVLMGALSESCLKDVASRQNAAGRSPALEALFSGQPQVFALLADVNMKQGVDDVLLDVLTARRSLVDADLLSTLLQNPQTASYLQAQAFRLARRLARLSDHKGFETLLKQFSAQILQKPPGRTSNVLHAVAEADDVVLMQLLLARATKGQLRSLADAHDASGRRPDECTTDEQLRKQISLLRSSPSPVPARPQVKKAIAWPRLKAAVKKISEQTDSAKLEGQIIDFCRLADAIVSRADVLEKDHMQLQALAWQVVDHIDRAPFSIGVRMGVHFAVHRPEMSDQALQNRAQTTLSGASRFSRLGGLALLKARSAAVAQASEAKLAVGMRMVLDVPAQGLAGVGYKNLHGCAVPSIKGETLRAVFAQDPQAGLVLVTTYPC